MKRIIVLFLALVMIQSGCTKQQKTKEELLSEGLKLVQDRDPRGAVILFKNALDKDQNYFEARFQLAKAYYAVGKYDAAEKELQKVQRQNPSSREVRIELARIMAHTDRPDEALKEISEYLQEGSRDCEALEIAGWCHAVKEEYPTAVSLLKKAVAACGDQASPTLSLATVYSLTGSDQEAETLLAQVLAKEPTHRKALLLLADLQARRKEYGEAQKTLDRLIQAHPGDPEAQYQKGMLHLRNNDPDSALALAQEMIKKFPKRAEGHQLQGVVLFSKKQYNESISSFQKVVQMQPNAATFYLLGMSHYFRNELEQAMGQLQKALELQPAFTQAQAQLALIFLKKGRPDDAIREAKNALSQDNENAFAHNVLGSAYLAKGNNAEGLAELNKALELDPSMVDAHFKKGLVAMRRGKAQEAEAELAAAVRLKPEAQDTKLTLAMYYMNTNEPAKAIDVLKKGLQGGRADAPSYYLMAESYLRQNNINEAMAQLTKAKEANPKYDLAYLRLAAIYFMQEKQDKGVQELRSLLEQSPDNVSALLLLASFAEMRGEENEAEKLYVRAAETKKKEGVIPAARYFQRMNSSDKALKMLNEAISQSPKEVALYEVKGQVLLAGKKYKEALATFEAMERINPQAGFGYVVNTYLALGEPGRALEKVRSEITKNPTNLRLRAELSMIHLRMGNKTEAVENAKDIIRKNPDAAAGYLALAQVYQSGGEIDKSIEALKGASKVKDAAIDFSLGNLFAIQKNYPAALEHYRRAEAMKGGSDQILFQKATMLQAMGKRKDAEAEYLKVLRLSPAHAMALNNLAYLYAEDNRNLQQALAYASRAFMVAPYNDYIRDTLGYVLLKSGKADEALKMLKKAAEGIPNNPSILYHLALAYHQKGDAAKASDQLQKALARGEFPEAGEARQLLEKIKKNSRS